MSLAPFTPAAYATAKLLYARYQDGDALEFEQEMDATLPAELLLCQLDEAFQAFRAQLDALGATFPLQEPGHEDLAELMAAAAAAIDSSRQALINRFVRAEAG
ncbi:MAG TPA: hypothetical protein VGV17_24825 [Bosea sp. (in: a-proteobacteria)]|jgi:hypothetical protein|uniref:hypothetical protein n=1 Tax=Bosea sp. (in: a-proteobacteria) TaxID=1871050 RepID=UPI002DDD822B|nr:hypothetical protein [Bosea sp. (in: a-proteobacteria)]HEV2556985.1 hypothetical protein [Bosea sp. (in: a-proteobacteria)]